MKLPPPWYIPELSRFPSRETRRLAERRIYFRTPCVLIWPALIGNAMIHVLLSRALFDHFPVLVFHYKVPAVIAGAVSTFVFIILIQLAFLPLLRREFRKELNRCGVPICIRCGYDLRGNSSPHCPECGKIISSVNVQQ